MLQRIRNSHYTKGIAFLLAVQLFISGMQLDVAFAGDGGPTQPEVHSFEPIGTDQMVDLFSGDFTYNIPLFNLPGPDGGYPINLAYHSGVQMDQEASWVGLGWNINMGTINRQVRNLPDDFGGESEENITIKTDMRPNWTVGVGASKTTEIFGFEALDPSNNVMANLGLNLTRGITLHYNNFKGIGYSGDFGISLKMNKFSNEQTISGDLGYNLKLDSREGISSSFALSADYSGAKMNKNISATTGFNNRTGWQRSLNVGGQIVKSIRLNATLNFASPVVSVQAPQALRGGNGSFSKGSGINVPALFLKKSKNIFFSFSHLKNKAKPINYKGIGYMYYQNTNDIASTENDYRVKDISRDNDGLVHKDTRRLASPTLSFDIYSVTGQGIGNMFRPMRADIGTAVSPFVTSKFYGGNLGFEKNTVGVAGTFRKGIDIGFQYSGIKTSPWPNNNQANYPFINTDASLTRSVYFKNYGDLSSDEILNNYGASVASNKPVAYGLKGEDNFYNITNEDQNNNGSVIQINTQRTTRRKRGMGVEAFTNDMIMMGNDILIPEFNVQYYLSTVPNYNKSNLSQYKVLRQNHLKSRLGGYIATNEGGMRYVYALPAQNKKERDVVFSLAETPSMLSNSEISTVPTVNNEVDYKKKGTDKYYNSVEKKEYAHSYLLTSILGMDYVDMDDVAGPSDKDLGYWVKFNYLKAHDNYKWRSPYKGAIYNKGYETSFTDGKGLYSYGEKEIWYVATAETKTHIAEFVVSPRNDCKQVADELNGNAGSGSYYKLDRIDVYTKSERYKDGVFNASAKPVQSCHFTYDYTLCKGTPDNNNVDGKLTLKKIHFTYRNNLAGAARPYTFEYNTTVGGQEVTYNRDAVDRWGNYQPGGGATNIDYPYNDPLTAKATMDQRAALWNMKAINMPSGGRYEIDYESDSYAYVQNEVAMQMFKIASLEPYSVPPTTAIQHSANAPDEDRKVYFALEKPISTSLSAVERKKLMDRYIHIGEYLYFKVKINLTKNNGTQEYVAGYTKVNDINVDQSSGVGGNYLWGYVTLDYLRVNGESTKFHPFTEAGSRHIRYNQPSLLYEDGAHADMDDLSVSQIKNVGATLLANAKDLVDVFKDFTSMLYGNGNDRLSDINLDKSYLRLRTPDKVKFGGGHRVKEIRVIDNWAASFLSGSEATSTYGTVYDYSMTDENGEIISSGVATYEPMVGGDEIALRNPIKGWEDKNASSKTTAQTYTEEPGNESIFPGPSVGYRQVRVMSTNTSNRATNGAINYGGISQYEFYTAKDYPVITDQSELETDKTFRKSRLIIPAVIVNIDRLRMAATQGYYIELNDMHGKPKAAKEYSVNAQNVEEEISSVNYEYFDEPKLTTNRAGETFITRTLTNKVDVLYHDYNSADPTQSDIRQTDIGTEVEFIPETRYHQSRNFSAGLQLNFEIAPITMLFPVPSFNWQEEKTGTVVTNKIVNKTGIMKKVTARQRGSISETENLVFDDITGTPLLTSVTNDYGNKVYNYSIMAREQYTGTGAAYETIGQTAIGSAGSIANGLQEITLNTPSESAKFVSGDVMIATPMTYQGGSYSPTQNGTKVICHLNSKNAFNNSWRVETKSTLSGYYSFMVIRSGKRNTLTSAISSITALSDPTKNRIQIPCEDHDYRHPTTLIDQSYTILSINNVLSISAVELGHQWHKDSRQLGVESPSWWYDNSTFSKGFGGVYSPVRSYAYIDNRNQNVTSNATDVRLETDGDFDNVPLFNWDRLQTTSASAGCITKWREVDQITMKNPSSFDIESRNPLKIYSATLFGLKGTEPIAKAVNARNTEIGSENFEEYSSGSIDVINNATNNLNFYTTIANPGTARYVEDRFDVVSGSFNRGQLFVNNGVMSIYNKYSLRIHFDAYYDATTSTYYKAEEVLVDEPTNLVQWSASFGCYLVTLPTVNSPINTPFSESRRWRGEIYARKTLPNYPATTNTGVSIVNNIGHTGNKCLGVTNLAGSKFLQGRLSLLPSKEYQFSGWVSSPNVSALQTNYNSFFYSKMRIEFLDQNGGVVSYLDFNEKDILQGMFIDDWQKFTINFTMPSNAVYASIVLPTSMDNSTAYYDDLRLQPRDAGMVTNVYNTENQRLEAQLDDNNYATFYYYDDEGNLFLVKRETEKGIITVQESRSYLRKN
jgi:hypothetical protein